MSATGLGSRDLPRNERVVTGLGSRLFTRFVSSSATGLGSREQRPYLLAVVGNLLIWLALLEPSVLLCSLLAFVFIMLLLVAP